MDFAAVFGELKKEGLAAIRYEPAAHSRFRDCLTIGRNGRILFERFNYGEAAGLVFRMWARGAGEGGAIDWDYDSTDYSKKTDAPVQLTGRDGDSLQFDGKAGLWQPAARLKAWGEGGLGRLAMLFGGRGGG